MSTPTVKFRPQSLFRLNYQYNPDPVNTATHGVTRALAASDSAHPFHIRTVRRLRAFDPSKLHWRVFAPPEMAKKFIRDHAKRRVREAFADELRAMGWERDGSVRTKGVEEGAVRKYPLSGAVGILLNRESISLTATSEEVRQAARWGLQRVIKDHGYYSRSSETGRSRDTSSSPRRSTRHGTRDWPTYDPAQAAAPFG